MDSYSKKELEIIVANSNSWHNLAKNLGYNCNSGDLKSMLQKRIESFDIDVSHFKTVAKTSIERNEGNIFIENSTADQKVVRYWYKKIGYTPYVCSICKMQPFWNGKELTLILDHVNGVNTDDRIENLRWVCPNCNMQLPTTNRRKERIKTYCIDCGIELSSKNSKRCRKCQGKNISIMPDKLPVSRDELKELIRTIPFTKIGEKFRVTDSTIRKWCDKFELPRKVSDIRKYSDEEWLKI